MREWDGFDASIEDDERTGLTDAAIALGLRSVAAAAPPDWCWAEGGAVLRVRVGGYVTEFRGQSSAGGHGMQGSDPRRIAALRELDEPVRMVFVDQGARKWQAVWLGIDEPEVVNVDLSPDHRRQGWRVREMQRGEGLVPFPEAAPTPTRAEERMAI